MPAKKSKPAPSDLAAFLTAVPEDVARAECLEVAAMMHKAEGSEPKLWSGKMLGFGDFHYRYATGHEGDTFVVGFAYRKTGFSIYLGCGLLAAEALLAKLGKHKTGVGCLYIRRLADVDRAVLKKLITAAVTHTRGYADEMKSAATARQKPKSAAKRQPTAKRSPTAK